jgi:hypothetical protein
LPPWRQGDRFVPGPSGIAVGVAEDSTVEVAVCVGDEDAGGSLLTAGQIAVGRHGVTVGTPTGMEDALPVAAGETLRAGLHRRAAWQADARHVRPEPAERPIR